MTYMPYLLYVAILVSNKDPARTTRTITMDMDEALQTSSLLRLSAELRNAIYHYAMVSSEPIDITTTDGSPSILVVCKQIRREGAPIFASKNAFVFRAIGGDCEPLLHWLGFKGTKGAEAVSGLALGFHSSPELVDYPSAELSLGEEPSKLRSEWWSDRRRKM